MGSGTGGGRFREVMACEGSVAVGGFAVRRGVEAPTLLVFRHAQPDQQVRDLVATKATTADHTMVTSTLQVWIHTCEAIEKSSAPVPPRLGAANTPVRIAPTMPPTPCTPKTSSASSAPSMCLSPFTPRCR